MVRSKAAAVTIVSGDFRQFDDMTHVEGRIEAYIIVLTPRPLLVSNKVVNLNSRGQSQRLQVKVDCRLLDALRIEIDDDGQRISSERIDLGVRHDLVVIRRYEPECPELLKSRLLSADGVEHRHERFQ